MIISFTMAKKSVALSWRIYLLRSEAQYLGTVKAPNGLAAIKVAIADFSIRGEQQHKLSAVKDDQ